MPETTLEAPLMAGRELSMKEVCSRLRRSRWYVSGLINDKKLLRARLEGNQYRILETDLQDYIDSTYIEKDGGTAVMTGTS